MVSVIKSSDRSSQFVMQAKQALTEIKVKPNTLKHPGNSLHNICTEVYPCQTQYSTVLTFLRWCTVRFARIKGIKGAMYFSEVELQYQLQLYQNISLHNYDIFCGNVGKIHNIQCTNNKNQLSWYKYLTCTITSHHQAYSTT